MTLVFLPSDGFGNLLFQHHAAYAFARENKLELCALGWYYDIRPKFAEYNKLFKHVKIIGNISDCNPTNDYFQDPQRWRINKALNYFQGRVHVEPGHTYCPIPNDARILSGYFQSWKYFDKFRIEIRDLLRSNENEMWETQKARHTGGVCVHVRWGGDGLMRPEIHPITSKDYYKKALDQFTGSKFLVFCEDPEIVKSWDIWEKHQVEFVDEQDTLSTFFRMSLCEHFIIANSSFSLGAYYMRENEDARLVFPEDWFGPRGPKFDLKDLVKI